ncbi:MAG: hypothetical protein M0R06_18555 [Sphaerochaeta sp.]|jgi:hypothetical protein|nr:hypothetical protein [Sphaerochaeta sp.]
MDVVELIASLPTNRTAVAFGGEGEAKISLDTDADQLTGVLAVLLRMRGKLLKVTFEATE